ncbi:MAG: hypothetical protein ABI548_05095 [Polyangiaceae bacterium]
MQAILFDYDDTLVRTRECKYRALQALAHREKSSASRITTRRCT